jgi:hypothetical protein
VVFGEIGILGNLHDTFHMVIASVMCQIPCTTNCQESEVARLTNQEEGRMARLCWKPIGSLVHLVP